MNGLRTRTALAGILNPQSPILNPGPYDGPDRRNRAFMGYHRFADDEPIPEPAYLPNAHGLGTPLERERSNAIRREHAFVRAFKVLVALAIVAGVFIVGFNLRLPPRDAIAGGVAYPLKAHNLAGHGKMLCKMDWHEGCLVCLHREAGQKIVSTHC